MDIEEYKQKVEQNRKRIKEIKEMDLPYPIVRLGFLETYHNCPVCGTSIKETYLNDTEVFECKCGYAHVIRHIS